MSSSDRASTSIVAGSACPSCGETAESTDRFCESCGHSLHEPPSGPAAPPEAPPSPPSTTPGACAECGGAVGSDGYCDECGRRAPVAADHVEDVLTTEGVPEGPRAAGVSDRGHRRRRNEDSFALGRATTPDGSAAAVVVVADGVASVPHGDTASRVACDVAVAAARDALTRGDDSEAAGAHAAVAARRAVSALAPATGSPPACTYVAAVITNGTEAVVDWVGDSRAYWLAPDGESRLLTEDDSWAAEMVAAGVIGADDAFTDPRAHVITRWLAADAPEVTARSVRCRLEPGGALLLCSDGVWNHIADPDTLAAVLDPGWLPDDVHAGARALVQAALDDGGTDNATAVLLAAAPDPSGGER